jgi:hypothetical protein
VISLGSGRWYKDVSAWPPTAVLCRSQPRQMQLTEMDSLHILSSITPALLFSTNRQFKNFYKMKHVTKVIFGMFCFMND